MVNKKTRETQRLPLTDDYIFKRVFAFEGNKSVLRDFLEAILKKDIKKVQIKNPEIIPYEKDEKRGLLDIKAEIEDGTIIDIEMQMADKKNTEEYVDMGYTNEEEIASKYIEFHYIELPKYKKKSLSNFTKLDQWMCIFTQNEEGMKLAEKENKEIKRAINTLDYISADPKERERHNSIIMAEYNRLTSERNFFKAGKEERNSRAEKKNGRKQRQRRNSKKMLKLNVDRKIIKEATGFTEEEIEKIENELK